MKKLIVALSLCAIASAALADVQSGFVPGEFAVAFRQGVQVSPKAERGVVRTGIASVDELNSRFGVYAARPIDGAFRFQVPAGVDILKAVAAYRALTEPVQFAAPIPAGAPEHQDRNTAERKRVGVVLAAVAAGTDNPAGLFDRAVLREVGATDGPRVLKAADDCNPAFDPDCGTPAPSQPACNPAFDPNCGSRPAPRTNPAPRRNPPTRPHCDPGINCEGDHPQNTPPAVSRPPANWSQRPSGAPRRWDAPPADSPTYERHVDTGWYAVGGYFGWPLEFTGSYGDWQEGSASFERGGIATGKGQRSEYSLDVKASRYANKYRRYYQYVGRNCKEYDDGTYCESWGTRYAWFLVDAVSDTRVATVHVRFQADQPLLPWESERFVVFYDGNRIEPRVGDSRTWAYDYRIEGPMHDNSTGTDGFLVAAGPKKLTAPDANGVTAGLQVQGGMVKLVVNDSWAMFYKGQPNLLDVAVKVKRETDCRDGSGWWHDHFCSNPVEVVFDSAKNNPSLRLEIPQGLSLQPNQKYSPSFIVDKGAGKYFIECSWGSCGFRRANSAISNNDWQNLGIERGQQEVKR
jgi:hypothetical protein